jgi:ketosteroid isomerase-like protein
MTQMARARISPTVREVAERMAPKVFLPSSRPERDDVLPPRRAPFSMRGMSSKWADGVLETNEAFYRAFANRDVAAMRDVWHETLPVVCVHPGWPALEGRERVLESWGRILENPSSPTVRCVRAKAHLLDGFALVVCYEAIGGSRLVATNAFARDGDTWRMVLHQAGPLAQPDEDDDEPEEQAREVEPSELN